VFGTSGLVPRLMRLCCIVFLMGSSLAAVAWGQQPTAPPDPFASLHSGSLTVWESGNASYLDWKAIRVALTKDFPQLRVTFRLVGAQDVVSALAWERTQSTLPDAVFVDNWMQAGPIIAQQSVVELMGQPRFQPSRGWWFLMMQGQHPSTALAFLRWLNDDPQWTSPRIFPSSLTASDKSQIEAAAATAVENIDHHLKTNAVMDPDASIFYIPSQGSRCGNIVEMANPTARFLFGNGKIAIMELAYEENARGGQVVCSGLVHSFLVLRKHDDGWKVLLLQQGLSHLQSVTQAENFVRLGLSPGPGVAPAVPTLLEPFDGERQSRFPKQDISWQQTGVRPAAYLVESQFGMPKVVEQKNWSLPAIIFVNPKQYGDVVRMPTPFGQGMQPHRWRVWVVGKDGQIALSEWRTVNFSN